MDKRLRRMMVTVIDVMLDLQAKVEAYHHGSDLRDFRDELFRGLKETQPVVTEDVASLMQVVQEAFTVLAKVSGQTEYVVDMHRKLLTYIHGLEERCGERQL